MHAAGEIAGRAARHNHNRAMLHSVLVSIGHLLAVPLAYVVPEGAVGLTPLVWLVLAAVDPVTARRYAWFGRRRRRAG
jgi:hypothetical protein